MSGILILVTEAFRTPGGVQTYMRALFQIATEFKHDKSEVPVSVVSLNDTSTPTDLAKRCIARFAPSNGGKVRFVLNTFQVARYSSPDVVVVGHLNLAFVALFLRYLGLIKSYLVVLHGIEAWIPCGYLNRIGCRWADGIVATTKFTAREFQIQNRFVHPSVYVVPLAVEIEEQGSLMGTRSPDSEPLRLLTVCRLDSTERYKGVDHLICAVAQLARLGVQVEFGIVGDGDDRSRLESTVARLGVEQLVKFHGRVSDAYLQQQYAEADVFAMPSKKEGFGIVFLEAMKRGKPCIGGRHGGTPEVIRNGVDGYLVEYGDVDSLAKTIEAFSRDRQLVASLGTSAAHHVVTAFNSNLMTKRWMMVLTRLYGTC